LFVQAVPQKSVAELIVSQQLRKMLNHKIYLVKIYRTFQLYSYSKNVTFSTTFLSLLLNKIDFSLNLPIPIPTPFLHKILFDISRYQWQKGWKMSSLNSGNCHLLDFLLSPPSPLLDVSLSRPD